MGFRFRFLFLIRKSVCGQIRFGAGATTDASLDGCGVIFNLPVHPASSPAASFGAMRTRLRTCDFARDV